MEWTSTLFGAAIGFMSSIGVIIAQRLLDRVGKIEIYAKVVYDRPTGIYTWGFSNRGGSIFLNVPLWLEIQNLAYTSRIIRDINLLLISDGKEVGKMMQSNRSGKEGNIIYANEGSYSLSINGREFRKLECHFLLEKNQDAKRFDEIYLCYYDEKNHIHMFSLGKMEGDWTEKEFPNKREWIKLKKVKKRR